MNIFNPDQVGSLIDSFQKRSAEGVPSIFDFKEGGKKEVSPYTPEIASFPQGPSIRGSAENRFESALKETIARVNETQVSADESVRRMAAGMEPNIHNTMLQLEQAEISLKLAMNVRAKALEAYQEIMRMQV